MVTLPVPLIRDLWNLKRGDHVIADVKCRRRKKGKKMVQVYSFTVEPMK